MIGLCSKCSNLAELYDSMCSICKMEKEVAESQIMKNPETVLKDALKKLANRPNDTGIVNKEVVE